MYTTTRNHTVRVLTMSGARLSVKLVKQLGGDWGYTLPSGRRIVQARDELTGRGLGFDLSGVRYSTLADACIASGEMAA